MINGRCDHSKFVSPNIHPSPMKAILISTVWWSRPSCLFLDDRAALNVFIDGEDMTNGMEVGRHDSTNRQRPRPNDVMCLVFVLQCGGCTTDEADIAPRAETI
uniref:Uncharacterized protein n=1 Tax=Globodera rostochiensis TaxID=31243 RepID=A0A914HDQ1_GLORO